MAYLDVTGVGNVNRRLGRTGGDALPRVFEARLRGRLTEPERVWRLGGDEYVLLTPGRSARSAARRVTTLQRGVAREDVVLTSTYAAGVTFRAGGATVPAGPEAARELFDAAAWALQEAKRGDAALVWSSQPHQAGSPRASVIATRGTPGR